MNAGCVGTPQDSSQILRVFYAIQHHVQGGSGARRRDAYQVVKRYIVFGRDVRNHALVGCPASHLRHHLFRSVLHRYASLSTEVQYLGHNAVPSDIPGQNDTVDWSPGTQCLEDRLPACNHITLMTLFIPHKESREDDTLHFARLPARENNATALERRQHLLPTSGGVW